jgi:hypothetical protein
MWIAALLAAPVSCNTAASRVSPAGSQASGTQREAVETVVTQLVATLPAIATFADVADTRAWLASQEEVTFGTCPTVSAELSRSLVEVSIEFGEACADGWNGDHSASGSVAATINTVARSVMIEFSNLTIDDRQISGTAGFIRSDDPGTGETSLHGFIDITTSDTGSAEGDIIVEFDLDSGQITISQATIILNNTDGTGYEATLVNIVAVPTSYGNFIPETGSIILNLPPTITITFDAQSPVDGTVDVAVGISPAVSYQIPGLP